MNDASKGRQPPELLCDDEIAGNVPMASKQAALDQYMGESVAQGRVRRP